MKVSFTKTKKLATVGFASLLLLTACTTATSATQSSSSQTSSTQSSTSKSTSSNNTNQSTYITDDDKDTSYDTSSSTKITLNGSSAEVDGNGAKTSGETVTISQAGTYVISGESDNVQILVDAADADKVHLVLDGAKMTGDKAPIKSVSAEKVTITLAEGSDNSVSDSSSNSDEDADAAIFSSSDLTINGSGSLTVDGEVNNAIKASDTLHIVGGTFKLTAVGDTINVNDELAIVDSQMTIETGEDAVKVDNDDDTSLGNMYLANNKMTISSGDDAIHASGALLIDSGDYTITQSVEGLEGTTVTVNDGTFDITASDDGINAANANLDASQISATFKGGDFTITMADGDTDAVDSNGDLTVDGANFDITGQSAFDFDGQVTYKSGKLVVNGEEQTEITATGPGAGGGPGGGGAPAGGGFPGR